MMLHHPDKNPMNAAVTTARRTSTATKRIAVLAAVLILALTALILDLVLAPVDEAKVQRLTVDATQTAPAAEIELVFAYGSQFSTLEPIGMQCTLESGIVEFDVTKNDETPNTYLVQASCPEENTESHASMMWNVLVSHDMTLSELLETGVCQIQVRVTLGHVVPVQHTVNLALKDFTEQENEDEEEGEGGDSASSIQPFVEVKHVNMDSLELGLGVAADPFAHSTMPETVEFLLPAFTIDAQPTHTTGAKILMDAVNATLKCNTEFNDDVASLTLVSRDGETPFYRPLLDLFVTTEVETTIVVTVDGDGSFLETFLGQDHTFSVQHGHEELDIGYNPLAARKTRETFEDAVTDCMKVKDDSGAFNMGMCVLLDYGDSFTLVTNMAMYDFGALTATEIMWEDKPGDAIQINATSLVEVADSDDTLDVSSSLLFGWDPDDILIDFSMTNEGTWRPFEAVLLANGAIVGDVFNMTFEEVTLLVEGSGMDGASGYFVVDGDSVTWNGRLDHGDDLVALEGGVSLDDLEDWVLQVGSNCIWDDQDIWDASVSLVSDSDEYGDSWNLTLVVSEDVSGYLSKGWISVGENDTEVLFTHDDNVLFMTSSISTDGPEEFVFSSRSNCTWNGEDKWNSEFQIVWDLHDFLDNGNLTVVYNETVSDLNMFTAVEVYDYDQWTLKLTDFTIEKRDVHYVDSTCELVVDGDMSMIQFVFEDEGKMDFFLEIDLTWYSDSNVVGGQLEKGVISSGSKILLNVLNGTFRDEEGTGNLYMDLEMPNAERQFRSNTDYSYDDLVNVLTAEMTEVVLFWQDETFADITGSLTFDMAGNRTFDLQMEDTTSLDMQASVSVQSTSIVHVGGGDTSFMSYNRAETEVNEAMLRVGSDTYVDIKGGVVSLDSVDYDFITWVWSANSTTTIALYSETHADVQFGLDYDAGTFERESGVSSFTTLDSLRLGWGEDNWILNSQGFWRSPEDAEFQMALEDTGMLDFAVAYEITSYDEETAEGTEYVQNLDRVHLRLGPNEVVDLSATLTMSDNENDDEFIDMQAESSETAMMQIALGMNMTMFDDGMAMLVDHVRLAWNDRVYMEAPMVVLEVTDAPTDSPTGAPTSSPDTTDSPTDAPTDSPTDAPTDSPGPATPTEVNVELTDISMTLAGMTEVMTAEEVAIYEDTMEAYYEEHYNSLVVRRLAASDAVTDFVTTVTVTDQVVNDEGNKVTYDQTVSYKTTEENTGEDDAWDLVSTPLQEEEERKEFLDKLVESNADFASVTDFEVPESDYGDDDAAMAAPAVGTLVCAALLSLILTTC